MLVSGTKRNVLDFMLVTKPEETKMKASVRYVSKVEVKFVSTFEHIK